VPDHSLLERTVQHRSSETSRDACQGQCILYDRRQQDSPIS
jgi:hypothetical protein